MMKVEKTVFDAIQQTLCVYPAECGGVLACDIDNHVKDFFFDYTAGSGNLCYVPSTKAIAHAVNDLWFPKGLRFGGIVHSHPFNAKQYPSRSDLKAAAKILAINHLDSMFLMITREQCVKAWILEQYGSLLPIPVCVGRLSETGVWYIPST